MYNSTLAAQGSNGRTDDNDQDGSGGGAGGSIQLTTLNLIGDSTMKVNGGSGSQNGGGGGSGGRLVMNYLKGYLANSQPAQSFYWTGNMDISGGKAG
jgi:hypothetical protein